MLDPGSLESKIKYQFHNKELLTTALTHSSYIKEHDRGKKSNERLEFLGDAFFDAIIGEELFKIFPHREEGFLSRARASLVCEKSLAEKARAMDIGSYLLLGNGENRSGGRQRDSILADAMESIIGAVYLDGGYDRVRAVVLEWFQSSIEDVKNGKYIVTDYKTALQEKLQAAGAREIKYALLEECGPDHDKTFVVQLEIDGAKATKGQGKSKKQAEQQAAEKMLEREVNVL
ncbi:MAG: ribonuclease III [Clostridiales bacterium]|nr:ribonuclease III [Clostridiales bacterium]